VQACGEDTRLLEVTLERLERHREIEGLDLSTLTRSERLIIILYNYEEMTFKEIGITLDLPEEKIGRMHESILRRKAS
jgi:DNA-directed RNA polymerase specialized sigma subunit